MIQPYLYITDKIIIENLNYVTQVVKPSKTLKAL